MSSTSRRASRPRLDIALALAAALLASASTASTDATTTLRWYGAGEKPLPFSSEEEVLEFLANAPVVAEEAVGRGIGKVMKLTLERDGIVLHGAFRTIDEEQRSQLRSATTPDRHLFRDHYGFEVAAYQLDRLLGLHRVPPTVERRIGGRRGSLQLWIEDAQTEADWIQSGAAKLTAERHLQRQEMMVFDNLIYNFDRHQNNMLYDRSGRLWFIDHTRAFKRLGELQDLDRMAVCDRHLFERMRAIDLDMLEHELRDYLGPMELQALNQRRRKLVEHFERLIEERGELAVLIG